jgi:hypothetical protein
MKQSVDQLALLLEKLDVPGDDRALLLEKLDVPGDGNCFFYALYTVLACVYANCVVAQELDVAPGVPIAQCISQPDKVITDLGDVSGFADTVARIWAENPEWDETTVYCTALMGCEQPEIAQVAHVLRLALDGCEHQQLTGLARDRRLFTAMFRHYLARRALVQGTGQHCMIQCIVNSLVAACPVLPCSEADVAAHAQRVLNTSSQVGGLLARLVCRPEYTYTQFQEDYAHEVLGKDRVWADASVVTFVQHVLAEINVDLHIHTSVPKGLYQKPYTNGWVVNLLLEDEHYTALM